MRTYEELLAAQTELMHFNPNHDPHTGQFAKSTTSMGLKNLKRAKTSNLTKWGTSPENNVLYITGYSGSGKSTTALSLARKNDTVIHLDGYSEMHAEIAQNKKFNDYLDKTVPDWKRMANATKDGNDGTMKRHSKEYWDTVDDFRNAIEHFGNDEFKKGNLVIVEGVQISDDWLSENKSYYADKPTIIMTTNPVTSMKRAFQRDERGGIISGLKSLDSAKEYIQWYVNSTKRLGDLSKTTQAKRGQKYIDDILSRYGGDSICEPTQSSSSFERSKSVSNTSNLTEESERKPLDMTGGSIKHSIIRVSGKTPSEKLSSEITDAISDSRAMRCTDEFSYIT